MILHNIQKYISSSGKPTGKILFYSDFRMDSGSEIFEQILIANGYTKFNGNTDTKQKRYTFITGLEKEGEKKENKLAFNDPKNKLGEYIQIILISSSGAEGISLSCVRQVHILEPYWNYIRIHQVLGRAIRLLSHIGRDKDNNPLDPPLLPPDMQNVEQYIYLSTFPRGVNTEEIYKSILDLESWPGVPKIDIDSISDINSELYNNYKDTYSIIQRIIAIKNDTQDRTIDQTIFDIMENKNKLSQASNV